MKVKIIKENIILRKYNGLEGLSPKEVWGQGKSLKDTYHEIYPNYRIITHALKNYRLTPWRWKEDYYIMGTR